MDNDGIKKKPDQGEIPELDKNGILKKDKSEAEESDLKTQVFPHLNIPEKEQTDDSDRVESVDLAIDEKIKNLEKPKRKDNRILIGILLVAVVLVAGILVFQKDRSIIDPVFSDRPLPSSEESGTETEQYIPLESDQPRTVQKEEIKTFELSDDIFVGKAYIQVKDTGPIISAEKDPELAAIANALLLRIKAIYGTTVGKRKDISREISSGSFQNFRISGIRSKQMDNLLADEISIKIPSGGTFFVKDGILDSVKKADYDQIQNDLKKGGISISKEILKDEGIIKVKLLVGDLPEQTEKNDFLIGAYQVGEIVLGMPISEMKKVLKGKFRMIKRNIMVENQYFSVYKVEDKEKAPLYFVYDQNGRIWGIQIVDSRFTTQKGIGIDSSLASIRSLCSKVKINLHPRKVTFATFDDLEIKFFLSDENIDFTQKIFPLQTKVSYIILGKSPYLD